MSQMLSKFIQDELNRAFPGDGETPGLYQSKEFTDALASAIQQYLISGVFVNPGIPTAGGPTTQATIAPGTLNAQ